LFNSAKVVVAIHGAGQANLVFCTKGTDVLEIIPQGFASTIFYDIANKVQLKFNYIMAKSETSKTTIKSNIIVNMNEVTQKLRKIMTSHKSFVSPSKGTYSKTI